MKKLFCLFLLVALSSAYTDRFFQMHVKLNPDGNAHVVEKTTLNLDSQVEKEAFEYTLQLGHTTLDDWRKYSKNVRYHLSGSVVNPRMVAARELSISVDAASITLEYDANNATNTQKTGSRTTKYELNTNILSFSQGRGGEITLGNNMEFELELPKDAVSIKISPDAGIVRKENNVKWAGPTTGRWDVSYVREMPLSDEVNLFLLESYERLRSPYLLGFLAVFALVLIALKIRESRS